MNAVLADVSVKNAGGPKDRPRFITCLNATGIDLARGRHVRAEQDRSTFVRATSISIVSGSMATP